MFDKSREGSKTGENSEGESGGGGGAVRGGGYTPNPLDRSSIECNQENSVFTSNSGLVSLKCFQ